MLNSSIYSSVGRTTIETQKQNSKSIDYHSVNSSCMTSKKLKSLNHFRFCINNYYRQIKSNNSISLNVFNLKNMKTNFQDNKKIIHIFTKTKSSDYIIPDIPKTINLKKNFKNLKISINNDYNNNIKKYINTFSALNKSNFNTTVNSNSIKLKNKSKKLKNSFSFTNNNIIDNYNIHNVKLKREYLYDYLDKTKKIILYKYSLNNLKKLVQLENEKIVTNIEQHNLNLNLLQKLYFLFQNYILALDNYFLFLKQKEKDGKKEITKLIENKKILINEIFSLGHQVYRIKNKLNDYLSNKFFLLSVKNQTKNFENFSSKDKNEFNCDLLILHKLEEQLDSIFIIKKEKKEETKDKTNIEYDKPKKEISLSDKGGLSEIIKRKRFFSQNSIGDSIKLKKIYRTPKQFMKDLNLISIGINNSLKEFNKIQLELLQDKKELITLNEEFYKNENKEIEFITKKNKLKNKLKNAINYYKYLQNNKNILISRYKKKFDSKDILLIKIRSIINNIRKYGDQKLLNFIESQKDNEDNPFKENVMFNNKLFMLKIIENSILFLKNSNNEYKLKENEKFLEIEASVNYLSRINNYRIKREKEKTKKKLQILNIMKKSHNLLFLPNKKNLYVNNFNNNMIENKLNKNKKDELKMSTIDYGLELNF